MKTKLASLWLAFDEPGSQDLCFATFNQPNEIRFACHCGRGGGGGRDEMVMSIDYLWVYDPAVSLCILKSTQIIGSTNFVFRVAAVARKFLRGEARTDGGPRK